MFFDDHREDYVERCRKVILLLGGYNKGQALALSSDLCSDAMHPIALELDGTRDLGSSFYDALMRINKMELDEEKQCMRRMLNDSCSFMNWIHSITEPAMEDVVHFSESCSGCIHTAFTHADRLESEFIMIVTVAISALDVMERLGAYRMYADIDAAYERFRQFFLDAYRCGLDAGIFTDPIPEDFELMKE